MNQDVALSELNEETRKQLSGPALRGFFAIAYRWKLTLEEEARLLGVADIGTVENWRRQDVDTLSVDVLMRISCLLGVFKALIAYSRIVFKQERGYEGTTMLPFCRVNQLLTG